MSEIFGCWSSLCLHFRESFSSLVLEKYNGFGDEAKTHSISNLTLPTKCPNGNFTQLIQGPFSFPTLISRMQLVFVSSICFQTAAGNEAIFFSESHSVENGWGFLGEHDFPICKVNKLMSCQYLHNFHSNKSFLYDLTLTHWRWMV